MDGQRARKGTEADEQWKEAQGNLTELEKKDHELKQLKTELIALREVSGARAV